MKQVMMSMGYGFLIWLVPFVLGIILSSLISTESALFDTLMAISLTASASLFSFFYLSNSPSGRQRLGPLLFTGMLWFSFAILLDAPIFLLSDFTGMSASEYFADIGLSYLIIPIIVMAVGTSLNRTNTH